MRSSTYEIILPLIGRDNRPVPERALLVNGLYGAIDVVDEATASKLERYNYCTSKLHNDFMRFAVQAVYNQLYPEVAYVPNAQSANDLYANERQMAAKIAHYALYRRPAEYICLDDTLALLTCALDESGPSGSWLDAIHENVEMPLNMESMDQYFTLCDDIVSVLK